MKIGGDLRDSYRVESVEQGEKDTAEGSFAARRVVPLLQRVNTRTLSSRTDSDGGYVA